MPDNVLSISNLSVSFLSGDEEVKALDDISFSIHRGKTLGIVGESGSGKSVTALAIMRLLQEPPARITSGKVMLTGKNGDNLDLFSLSSHQMQQIRGNRVSMIFQEPMTSLNPVIKCGKQVVETIRCHQGLKNKEAIDKTLRLFNEVKLPRPGEIFNAYPHELSGGQKQRVMIAMAVSSDPEILIADEPTTALDVTVQKAILNLLRDLQLKYNMSVLFITHDLALISETADDLVVINKGKIVESGPVAQVFRSPTEPYTRGLIACRPRPEMRLKRLPTINDFVNSNNRISVNDFLKELQVSPENHLEEKEEVSMNESVLQTKGLSVLFPLRKKSLFSTREYIKAVDDVTIDVKRGEIIGLVGESGCGKTTLGRAILRLKEPDSGEVIFRGKAINDLNGKEMKGNRKQLQIVFQDPYSSLNPRMMIGEAIMEPMRVHKLYNNARERKERVMVLLEKVGLERKHYYRYPHEFSGGQRQRVCIARALSVEPDFIICDESVSALDVSVQAQVLNLLNDLKREFGLTYIFISHDLSVVKFMSDRIIVMKDGKIIEEGTADEVYDHPRSEYTRNLIAAIPAV